MLRKYLFRCSFHNKGSYKAIGFILANEKSSEPLSTFAVTVNDVEEITSINFYHLLPDEIDELLESNTNPLLWFNE